MPRHLTPLLVPVLALGCRTVPVPTLEVAELRTSAATEEKPAARTTGEPRTPQLTAKERAARERASKEALAACHLERWAPVLTCDLDPNCAPKDPPTTVKEEECGLLLWLDFTQSEGTGSPCDLWRWAGDLDEVVAANDKMLAANDKGGAGAFTIAEVARAWADYRAALVEKSSALKDLADAKVQDDTPRIVADHLRIERAIRLQEEAKKRHMKACSD
jgi:hypothetical protein